jgi:hypothetical protein
LWSHKLGDRKLKTNVSVNLVPCEDCEEKSVPYFS